MVEAQQDIFSQIINNPLFWIFLILIVVFFIVRTMYKNRKRPEEQPFYGVKVREEQTDKMIKRRSKIWGRKSKLHLRRGLDKIGKVLSIETFYRILTEEEIKKIKGKKKHKEKRSKEDMELYHNIAFRNYGLIAMIKALLLNRYEHLIVSPFAISFSDRYINIDPKAFLIDDSGVWILSDDKELKFIDDLNTHRDILNIKGFSSDFLRRLSTQSPLQAIALEKMTHESDLKEKERQARVKQWSSG